jgi:hypothetical protein
MVPTSFAALSIGERKKKTVFFLSDIESYHGMG